MGASENPRPVAAGYQQFVESKGELTDILDRERAALIVVDVQNDYCHLDGALGAAGFDVSTMDPMCSVIDTLRSDARRWDVPVVFLKTIHSPVTDTPAWRRKTNHSMAICREGTWGAEYYRLRPDHDDLEVIKHRYSGFIGTNLAQVLAALGRTTVTMTGTATNVCVESTARDACMLDYDVVVVEDGVAATDPAAHRGSLENLGRFFGHVVSSESVREAWAARSG